MRWIILLLSLALMGCPNTYGTEKDDPYEYAAVNRYADGEEKTLERMYKDGWTLHQVDRSDYILKRLKTKKP